MKTEQIVVSSKGQGMDGALTLTETLGKDLGLDRKSVLHLRLLAEELVGMLRGIAGEVEARYWIEYEGKKLEIHMTSDVEMSDEIREQLLAASTSGKNAAAASFMGKIRVMIADMLLSAKEVLPYAMINTVAANPAGAGETSSIWLMSAYREEICTHAESSEEAGEAWDQLEKSIVANIADEIKVSFAGKSVGITVYKAF